MCWCLVRLFTCVFSFLTFHMRFLYPADPWPCFPYSSCNDGIWIEIDCWRTQSTGKVDRDGYWERIQPIYLSFLIVPSDNLRIQWENTSNVFVILKNTFKGCGKLIISAFVSGAKIIKHFPIHFGTSLQHEKCDMTQFCNLQHKLDCWRPYWWIAGTYRDGKIWSDFANNVLCPKKYFGISKFSSLCPLLPSGILPQEKVFLGVIR